MKIKKIINIFILTLSIMTIFSCNYNNYKNNVIDHHIKKNRKYLANISKVQLMLQKIYINNIIYFNINESNINMKFFKSLDYISNFLKNNQNFKICISGYGDMQGTNKHNLILGMNRANAIQKYLKSKGVPSEHMSVISYGKNKPNIDSNNECFDVKNRRAIVIVNMK